MPRRIYCSIADDHIGQGSSFANGIIRSVLFDGDPAAADAYWYGHGKLLSLPDNVLLPCLRHGVIQPYFRCPENIAGSFAQGLADWGKLGVSPLPGVEDRIQRLDKELAGKMRAKYAPQWWPAPGPSTPKVGQHFAQIVDRLVSEPEEPADPKGRKRWDRTRRWRKDCMKDAIERTSDKTLRRGELLQVIWETLPSKGESRRRWPKKVDNNLTLMRERLGDGGAMRTDFEVFYAWILQCYHAAQADSFLVGRQFFPSVGDEQLMQLASLQNIPPPVKPAETMRVGVLALFPRPSALLRCSFDELLRIRDCEGKAYFAALDQLRESPSATKAENAANCLRLYASELCKRYKDTARDPILAYFSSLDIQTQLAMTVTTALPMVMLDAPGLVQFGIDVAPVTVKYLYSQLPANAKGVITGQLFWQRIGPTAPLAVTKRRTSVSSAQFPNNKDA